MNETRHLGVALDWIIYFILVVAGLAVLAISLSV